MSSAGDDDTPTPDRTVLTPEQRDRRLSKRPDRILGRQLELSALNEIVQHHAAGAGAIVAIDGEAGIGKTTLLAALVTSTRDSQILVVWLHCSEADRLRPFGAFLDALECRLQHPDPAYRRVAELIVSGTESVTDPFRLDTDAAWRRPVQEAIVDLVVEALDRGPVLLAVDDIQLADAGTTAVLTALARRTIASPLVLAWSQRSTVRSESADQLKARFRTQIHHVAVGPLEDDAVEAFGADLLGRPLDEVERVRLRHAGGNPFFVTALAANAFDATRAEVLKEWLGRLSSETANVITTAALLGGEFTVGVLARVVGRPGDEVVRLLEPAVVAGILVVRGAGGYGFAHDLIRLAAEANTPRSLRAAMHREIARVLESIDASDITIARHIAYGARPGDHVAAERIRIACVSLMRVDSLAAAQLLEAASGLCVPGSDVWASVIADQVLALQWGGKARESLHLANAALTRELPGPTGAKLRMVQATSLGLLNDLPGAAAAYRAVADDPVTQPSVRALVLAELATIEAWGMDRIGARRTADDALQLSRSVGATQAELQSLCALSTMSLFDGHVADGITHAREAVTSGRNYTSLVPAREVYLGLALANADEHDEAAIWFRKGQSEAEAVSDLWLVSRFQLARMSSEVLTGEWESVIADAEAVISLHEDTGMGTGMPQAPAAAGVVSVRRGAPGAVIDRYRELATRYAKEGAELPGLMFTAWMEGLIAETERRFDDAAGIFTYLHDTVIGNARLVQVWLAPDVVRVLLAAGDKVRAGMIATEMTDFARNVVRVQSAYGTAELCEGLVAVAVGNHDRAGDLLRRSVSHLRTARRLPALLQALDSLQCIDGDTSAERAQLARRLGIQTATPSDAVTGKTSAAHKLTRTETAIASLIAAGLANPAIARELGLSKRTVEYHVSNIYMKFAVTSRVAAAHKFEDSLRAE